DALPAPRIDLQAQRSKSLRLRIGRNTVFRTISAELPAYDVFFAERRDGFQNLNLLIADGLAVGSDRRFHRQIGENLEQGILNHVADGSGLVVERAAALDAELLRHGDLDTLDVVAIPIRLYERIREAEVHDVLDRAFCEVMIDAEDRRFGKRGQQDPVQFPC